MDKIESKISELLTLIRESEVYEDYKKQEENIERNPELKARVDAFRTANFRLQNEVERDNLFQAIDQITRESAQLRNDPQVNAYLDAELALCRLMQKIGRTLTEGINMNVPEL
jgi:cell fate (sporulation/competence/biofilm development) regulator YlbF (YheA/YmcA/DUF963 family)